MQLTHKLLHELGTSESGFNASQLRLLGVPLPPRKGWLSRLIGTEIDATVYDRVKSIRGIHRKDPRRVAIDAAAYRPAVDLLSEVMHIAELWKKDSITFAEYESALRELLTPAVAQTTPPLHPRASCRGSD